MGIIRWGESCRSKRVGKESKEREGTEVKDWG